MNNALAVISTILKHENKVTSYKIALIRAINDIALSYPEIHQKKLDIAIPLRKIADFWLAYYWPFADPNATILQGPRAKRKFGLSQDISFRNELMDFRTKWEMGNNFRSDPSDGFFIINEFNIPRRRNKYNPTLILSYDQVIKKIATAISQPIRYSGVENWEVFEQPIRYSDISRKIISIPGTRHKDKCLIVSSQLWESFLTMSLYIEALCIHQWCLFTENVSQPNAIDNSRGHIYELLTCHPENRRPLTWERNQVDVLLMEGNEFTCPWSGKLITAGTPYDLDHIIPVSVYPMNELWNLVPSDPDFNSHTKRDRLPTSYRFSKAAPIITHTYHTYQTLSALSKALQNDVAHRFYLQNQISKKIFPEQITQSVIVFANSIGEYRNLPRF